MSYNFNRTYVLNLEDVQETKDLESFSVQQDIPITLINPNLTEETVNGVKIVDLHIDANITFNGKTSGKDENSTTINIYNLNKQTRDRFAKPNVRVVLSAGYDNDNVTVFTGQVISARSNKVGSDIVTTLLCKDGWTPLNSIRFSKSYGKDTPYVDIFDDIISAFNKNGIGTASGGIILDKANPPYRTPNTTNTVKTWAYSGFLRDALESLCNEFSLTYQIIHSRLYIYPKEYNEMFGFIDLRNQDIISINKRQDGTNLTSSKVTASGIELTTLLNGNVTPATRVRIKNDRITGQGSFDLSDYEGEYIISNMRHHLSYEGNDWYTTLQCDGIKEDSNESI